MHRRIALALAATLIAAPLAALPTTAQADEADTDPALSLRLPSRTVAYTYGARGRAEVPLAVGLRAGADPFELWATRPSYDEGIRTVWKTADGDVELPAGSMKDFAGLHRFLKFSVKNVATGKVDHELEGHLPELLRGAARPARRARHERRTPTTARTTPTRSARCRASSGAGRATCSAGRTRCACPGASTTSRIEMAPKFVEAFGLDPADVKGTTRVIVKKGKR